MSPTVFQYKEYRFYFFSREESRMHIHVYSSDGEAKFWLEPAIALANSYGLTGKQLRETQKIVEERKNEITKSWKKHFKG
jgi:hypothetical protein